MQSDQVPDLATLLEGEIARWVSEQSGRSVRQLALRAQVEPTYLSHVRCRRRDPSAALLCALVDEMGTPAEMVVRLFAAASLPLPEVLAIRGTPCPVVEEVGA